MTTGQDARLFDLGYRRYDGPRERPARAILTLAEFTARRVLGLGRGTRHKVLPAITLAIAFLPALVSVVFAVIVEDIPVDDLISYGDYMFIIGSALALFAALVAPEALCPDRRTGMLGLYLSGPLDRTRYLVAKGAGVARRHAPDHARPAALHAARVRPRRLRAARHGDPGAPAADPRRRGHDRASLRGSVDGGLELHDRRAAAAVGVVLLLFVPASVVRSAIESAGAPNELDLLSSPFVAAELAYRIFGETPEDVEPVTELSTWLVAGGVGAAILAGALVCWLRYRRLEAFR